MAKKTSKKKVVKKHQHVLHKPHVHASFSLIIVSLLVIATLAYAFSRPIEYSEVKQVSSKNNSLQITLPSLMEEAFLGDDIVEYEHRSPDAGKGLLSHVRLESQYVDSDVLSQKKTNIIRELRAGKGQLYESFTSQPLASRGAEGLSFSGFQNQNLGNLSDGLMSDFSYNYEGTEVRGQLLIAFSNDRIYTLVIEAVDDIWTHNQSVWALIIQNAKAS